ncbi:MAG TPA: ATP-binding protein [Phycisphaerae bacterium]|nr:ATP-binding protein [Phycisphaerae bacterium]
MDSDIRFTPAGERIEVDTETSGERVTVRFADTGVGIDEERPPHVIDRFYRTDTTRQRAGGFGLGLPIRRMLVTALDGEIRIDSKPGEGTSVYLEFSGAELKR